MYRPMRCIAFQLSPEEKPLSLNRQKRMMWYEQSWALTEIEETDG